MYLLGYDIGSSFVKATLIEAQTGKVLASTSAPDKEMQIVAKAPGWAEQDPRLWWQNVIAATAQMRSAFSFDSADVEAIGISYQMHGLVIIDKNQKLLRPAIIWCDGRAVEIANRAAKDIGEHNCLKCMLNLPGNFTASRLKWVMENEPDTYKKIYKAMLPGDYIAMRMTDKIVTTPSGLSEWIIWDFQKHSLAKILLDYYGISEELTPQVLPTFSIQGELTKKAADELGLKPATVVSYRAGDQPNNALSLNVLNPGEVAATAGTSGVVYGITDKPSYDDKSRVNTFVHVNYTTNIPRYGVLLCVSGTGILNSWLQHNVSDTLTYDQMNELAAKVPIGSDGLMILPYGNGAERTLENRDIGASFHGLNFNTHNKSHLLRAAQEGIVFALSYGLEIMHNIGVKVQTVRAGNANMFLSNLFSEAFATVTQSVVELYNTDGSQGAARGAGIGAGIYPDYKNSFAGLDCQRVIEPNKDLESAYRDAYQNWLNVLQKILTAK
ncbi:MAG: xylulokinase [Planctomycetota bacterium]|jgi:xylulokinase